MLLAVIAFVLALGAPGLTPASPDSSTPRSILPATQPGLGRDEGVFLVTSADDGSQAIYFIAQNTRHSILVADMQAEQRLNSLWPVRVVLPQDVVDYPESAPIGAARTGLLTPTRPASEPVVETPAAPAPVAADTQDQTAAAAGTPVADDDAGVADAQPTTYTVQRGDSAITIARKFNVDVEALLAANGVANRNRVYAGQALTIPQSS